MPLFPIEPKSERKDTPIEDGCDNPFTKDVGNEMKRMGSEIHNQVKDGLHPGVKLAGGGLHPGVKTANGGK